MANDLRQVSELFRDLISVARKHSVNDLDSVAEDWLKKARLSLLKDIEDRRAFSPAENTLLLTKPASYHKLSANATNLLLVPSWAIDSSIPLTIFTPCHPRTLDTYNNVFLQEIRKLMKDCGFVADVSKRSDERTWYTVKIRFPSDNKPKLSPCDTLQRLKIHQRFTLTIKEDLQDVTTSAEDCNIS
ncbi:hypothetical protein C0993_009770 [Termitomyces sp. T159_Od127]|nr:hypothetical protein C0993_009770 [Termitomyces sp. T159_Od127]